MQKKKSSSSNNLPIFSSRPILPEETTSTNFLGLIPEMIYAYTTLCVCVCVIDHRSQQSKFLWFLFEGVQFLVGLVFVFLFGGEVILCEIRESESELSQSWAISDFPKHLALVGLCCY